MDILDNRFAKGEMSKEEYEEQKRTLNTKINTIKGAFQGVSDKVTKGLKEGFGILTEIDVTATLKQKLDVDFKNIEYLELVTLPMQIKLCKQKIKLGRCYPAMKLYRKLK